MAARSRRRQSPTNPSAKILESGRVRQLADAGVFLTEDAPTPSHDGIGAAALEGFRARISLSQADDGLPPANTRDVCSPGDDRLGGPAGAQAKADVLGHSPSQLKTSFSAATDVIVPPHERAAEDQPPPTDDSLETDAFEIGIATDDELRPLIGSIDINSPVIGKIEDWTLVAVRNSVFPAPIVHLVGHYMGKHIRKTSAVTVIAADFRTARTMNSIYELGEKASNPFTALLAVILMGMRHAPGGEPQMGEHSFEGRRSWMI